jgi:Golgi phosphoprotein 3 (GPP34)
VNLADGIAVQLAALCLDDDGRLRDYALWDVAARGALLVDLARVGRLTDEPDGVMVDPAPTGFGPADRLLAAVAVEPEQSLDWWLEHGEVGMRDIAEAAVSSGRWNEDRSPLGRRYEDRSPAADEPFDPQRPEDLSPDATAVMLIAAACGALGPPEPVVEEELTPTGPLRWVCEAVTDHLQESHRRNLGAAGAADGGTVPYH